MGMRDRDDAVDAEVKFRPLRNEETGRKQDGVEVSCTKCGHTEQSFGEGPKSIKRCLALLRENCPEDEENFYTVGEEFLEEEE